MDERCGESLDGEMWPIGECCLRKGHPGDHYAVVTWPRWEPRPPSEAAPNRWVSALWAKALEHALGASVLRRVEPTERVVNRDEINFHHEPHPTLPGVVVPVLDQAVRMDPVTGAVEWD